MASLLQVAHLASLLQVVAPLASLLQVVLVQPLGLLALQQGVRLARLKRVDSGAARSFSPWAQQEALLEDKEKRRPCPRRSSAGRLRWHWT